MKFKYFLAAILLIIGCGELRAQSADATPAVSPSSPGEGHHGHWRHHHAWIWKKLNLTEAQKTQIKSIRQSMKVQTHPALAAVLKAKMKLLQDIDANSEQSTPALQTMVAADTSALANAESQFAIVRSAELNQIKTVLTPEQKATWQDFHQKRQTRIQDMISKLSQPTS
jgi:Spy/CpxP family protein refolding chaperone